MKQVISTFISAIILTIADQVSVFIFGEMNKEIGEIIAAIKKEGTQVVLPKELSKSLENLCGCLLYCLELLANKDLKFLNEYVLVDFSYTMIQVSKLAYPFPLLDLAC